MSWDFIPWVWIGLGLGLMLIELVVPGVVLVFLGAAAVLVGGLQLIGVLEGLVPSLASWMALSVLLVIALRSVVVRKLAPESRREEDDEAMEAFGQVVHVIEECRPGVATGRIRYNGTTWPAMTVEGTVRAGGRARLVFRENLAWVVEPASDDEDPVLVEAMLDKALQSHSEGQPLKLGDLPPRGKP